MKTNVQTSSLEAYSQIKQLNRKETKVLGVIIEHGPICNQGIADILDWPVNCVTGRTFDLRSKGLVEEAFREAYQGGRTRVIHWQNVQLRKIAKIGLRSKLRRVKDE